MNNEVIYQIYPMTFNYAAGSASDPYKGCYGNLKGIIALVSYVASLGVDAIWITPFYPWGSTGFGYDITDYYAISPMFGTIEDFKKLCDTYHAYGIRVIIDQVYNHCADKHPWFEKSLQGIAPYDEYFIWHPGKQTDQSDKPEIPNNWTSIWSSDGSSAWRWSEERKQYYMHSFDYTMPNLNINNPIVQDELLKIAKHWFDLGADGFRLDAATHYACDPQFRNNPVNKKGKQLRLYDVNTKGGFIFLNRLKELCDSYPVPKTLLAEYWYDKSKKGLVKAKQIFKESSCDAFFTGALNKGLAGFIQHVTDDLAVSPMGKKLNWAFSNHDLERAASRIFGEKATHQKTSMLMHLLMCLPGSVCIFQGEELGLSNPKDFSLCKNPKRDPLNIWTNFGAPWDAGRTGFAISPYSDDPTRRMALHPSEEQYENAATNQGDQRTTLSETRRAIQFRKDNALFHEYGNIIFKKDISNNEVIAFIRTDEHRQKQALCIFNFSDFKVTITHKKEKYHIASESYLIKELS